LDEKGVQGAEGVENGDGKSDGRMDDLGCFEPVKGGSWLGVGVGVIVFEVVMKNAVDDFIMIKMGVEGKVGGEVRFWRHDEGGEKFFNFWGGEKKVKDLAGFKVHEGVVHEYG
jgi:hypothetical protein